MKPPAWLDQIAPGLRAEYRTLGPEARRACDALGILGARHAAAFLEGRIEERGRAPFSGRTRVTLHLDGVLTPTVCARCKLPAHLLSSPRPRGRSILVDVLAVEFVAGEPVRHVERHDCGRIEPPDEAAANAREAVLACLDGAERREREGGGPCP